MPVKKLLFSRVNTPQKGSFAPADLCCLFMKIAFELFLNGGQGRQSGDPAACIMEQDGETLGVAPKRWLWLGLL
jgi:hypothetical protein